MQDHEGRLITDFGDGSPIETFEAHELRLIKGIKTVYREAPTLSRQRRDASTTLARTQYKPMVYEKGGDGTYQAEELPFAMNGPEAARRRPSKSCRDISRPWRQPPRNTSRRTAPWRPPTSPLAVMALAAADGSFCASPKASKPRPSRSR